MVLLYCVKDRVVAWYDTDYGVPAEEYGPECVIIPWPTVRTLKKLGPMPKSGYDNRPYAAPVLKTPEELISYAKFKHERVVHAGLSIDVKLKGKTKRVELPTDQRNLTLLHSVFMHAANDNSSDPKYHIVGRDHKLHALAPDEVMALENSVNKYVVDANTTLAKIIDAINQNFIQDRAMVDKPPAPLPPWPSQAVSA